MNPKVSIILTTCNRSKLLKRAVKSVLNQTFTNWELIIVDDASDDDSATEKLIGKFERKDERIRSIMRTKNFGQHTRPKNEGTEAAKADLIAYLDDDNTWRKDHLQALYKTLSEVRLHTSRIVGVYGDRMVHDDDNLFKTCKKTFIGAHSDWNPAMLSVQNYIDTGDVLLLKSAILEVGGWDESLVKFADWNLWLRLAKANMNMARIPLVISDYYATKDSNQLKSSGAPFMPDDVTIWPKKTLFGKQPNVKIAIFTLVKDRWEYTQKMLESLKKYAGYEYDHYIVDNGSTDDTVKELAHYDFHTVIRNKENKGISIASNQALDKIMKKDYDLVIKLDNDCELIMPDTVKRIADFYTYSRQFVYSPYVEKLKDNVGGGPTISIHGEEYPTVGTEIIQAKIHIGGIFCVAPSYLYKDFRWSEKDFKHGTQDLDFSQYAASQHMGMCYLSELRVENIDGTDGQKKKYARYFEQREGEKTTRGVRIVEK